MLFLRGRSPGVDVPSGSAVGPPSVVLQLLDVELHNDYRPVPPSLLPTRDYAWSASRLGPSASGLRSESQRASTLSPGPGMLCNCHFGLTANVGIDSESVRRDGAALRRNRDPGAGAVAPLHNLTHVATADIVAGSELFHDYGEAWFTKRGKRFGNVPFADNYHEADEIVVKAHDFAAKHGYSSKTHEGASMSAALWNLIRKGDATDDDARALGAEFLGSGGADPSPLESDELVTLLRDVRFDDPRTRAALPPDFADVTRAAAIGTARCSVPNGGAVRSHAWLEEHGLCMDNLISGTSKIIPQAGRGAFATRHLADGSVVAPVPLLLLPERRVLDMYALAAPTTSEGGAGAGAGGAYGQPRKISRDKTRRQLLLNYCFGHPLSTAVLLPYSSVVNLINHDPDREPNARLQWSTRFESANKRVTEMSIQEIKKMDSPPGGLMMELVATRDIAPGEEVVIDYGDRWDRAWRRHVERWEAPPSSSPESSYVPAEEMNAAANGEHRWKVRTFQEEQAHPTYPPNIDTVCYYDFGLELKGGSDQACSPLPIDLPNLLGADAERGGDLLQSIFAWEHTPSLYRRPENLRPCRIVAREQLPPADAAAPAEGVRYIALVKERISDRAWRRAVRGVPGEAVTFVDRPRTSDMHLAGAFRHELGLPDDVFPRSWLNGE